MTAASHHAAERFRLARLAVAAGAAERAVSTLTGVVRIALLTWALSPRDYGLYVAAFGIIASAGLADFGVQFGLVNEVSRARGHDDQDGVGRAIATAFAIYAVIGLVAAILIVPLAALAPLRPLLHLDPDRVGLARAIVAIGFGTAFLAMPLRVYPAAFTGLQHQHVASAYRSCAGVLQILLVAVSLLVWRGQLLPVVIASTGTDLVSGAFFGIWAYRRNIVVHLGWAARSYVRPLLGSGAIFFVSNIANLLKRGAPAIIVANALGTAAVPPFSVPLSLFVLGLGLAEMIASSLWPAYGEAGARGDWSWIDRAFALGSEVALHAAAITAVLGAAAGRDVIHLWAPRVSSPPAGLFFMLGIWMLSQAAINTAAALLCGLNRNRMVMFSVAAEGLMTCLLGAWLVRRMGIHGLMLTMLIAGALSAVFLNVVSVPSATERRIRVHLRTHARVWICAAVGALGGAVVHTMLSSAPTLVRFVATAVIVALAYATSAWAFGLSGAARARILQRIRRVVRT